MQYNYDFEVASLLFMNMILLHFSFSRQFPIEKTRIFRAFLLASITECAMNIVSCFGLANAAVVPQWANDLFAFVFFAFEGACYYLFFCYTLVLCEYSKQEERRIRLIGLIPFLIFEIMVLFNPLLHFFYEMTDNVYTQGWGAQFGYYYIILFFLLDVIITVFNRKRIPLTSRGIIYLYSALGVVAIGIQYLNRSMLLTSTAHAIVLILMYFSMQNPSQMLDPVTGYGNESALILQIRNRIKKEKSFAVITMDVRQFHHINAIFGYERANEILTEIGSYLVTICDAYHVFHGAGDTFTILVDNEKSLDEIGGKMIERFEGIWEAEQVQAVLNMSMVVQHYPEDFATIPEFIGVRNYMINKSKKLRNSSVLEADRETLQEYERTIKVEMALNRALSDGTLQVYYQPIYSVKDHKIVSLEALSRIEDEELGFIPPDEFIQIAEQNGSITQIGEQVLEECCKFLSKHVLSNSSLGIENIHVNISAVQGVQKNLTENILPLLEQYHIPPSMINLEITERAAVTAPSLLKYHMKKLGRLGVTFSMDDYGTGNSNCTYLIQFPFQKVKFDKNLVWSYFKKKEAHIVLKNEIKTVQELGMTVVVEGVETAEQAMEMEHLGVEYIQGYYYGKPMPEKECLRYIRNFNPESEEYGR